MFDIDLDRENEGGFFVRNEREIVTAMALLTAVLAFVTGCLTSQSALSVPPCQVIPVVVGNYPWSVQVQTSNKERSGSKVYALQPNDPKRPRSSRQDQAVSKIRPSEQTDLTTSMLDVQSPSALPGEFADPKPPSESPQSECSAGAPSSKFIVGTEMVKADQPTKALQESKVPGSKGSECGEVFGNQADSHKSSGPVH